MSESAPETEPQEVDENYIYPDNFGITGGYEHPGEVEPDQK